ncbi:MAG: hypothetical protein COA79_04525 [Planctomycetota bacterium]|nr:MAG: hypothetical protein COA79_04525 [Planctomycetota bacterium]
MSDLKDYQEIKDSIKSVPPLPAFPSDSVRVDSAEGIIQAITEAKSHTTIVIAKGHYQMPCDSLLTASHVTIRGETDNPDDVVLDGGVDGTKPFDDDSPQFKKTGGQSGMLKILRASNVTIANLTIANCPKYGLVYVGGGNVCYLKVYHCTFRNIWARGIKGHGSNPIETESEHPMDTMSDQEFYGVAPKYGEIRHCLFEADKVKTNDQDGFEGDYIAGMDLMGTKHFTIADNTFIGIRGKNGGARGAMFIWQLTENVTVENNHIYHCDKGIALGNPSSRDKRSYHVRNSLVRNNTIIGGSNKAIEIDHGNNVDIVQNTIESTVRKNFVTIQVNHITESSRVTDNTIRLHGEQAFGCDDCVSVENNDVT